MAEERQSKWWWNSECRDGFRDALKGYDTARLRAAGSAATRRFQVAMSQQPVLRRLDAVFVIAWFEVAGVSPCVGGFVAFAESGNGSW